MFRRTRFLARTLMSSPLVAFVYSPLLVAQTIAGIAVPFATGRFIDSLIDGTSPIAPFGLLASLLTVRTIMTPCLQRLVISRARDIEMNIQGCILDAVMEFSPSELSPLADGSLVAKLTRDAYAVGGFVSRLYPRLITAVVTMFAAGLALHSRSPMLGLSFVAFIPLCIILFVPFARRFSANSHAVRKRSDVAFATLFDFFRSLPFLRTLDAERRFADSPRQSLQDLKEGNSSMDSLTVAFSALLGAIMVVGEVSVLAVSGTLAAKGSIPVGDVVVYQMLFLAAMQSVQGIVSLLPETATLREGLTSLSEIFSHELPRHCFPKRYPPRPNPIKNLEFRNVTFTYPGATARPIVKDFSATFRSGEVVALVGANGTGKTTLLRLATAALEPQAGEILVNGTPMQSLVEGFFEGFFRRSVGIVFQDSLIVTGTVRDNITLRDPMFTKEDIDEAVALSGLEEVVKRLPAGLDTRVGLRGQTLSGGEMQRLAIARALVRKPDILVLDEVTNHLDADTRTSFGKLLRKLAPGRIILVVSHDPALIDLCDEKIFCQIPK
ncbi:MAG: ABC transporter ATP-binding protein [Kiritimatiellae bacterium]|nr:ABC transporter ATP-binding protein [Kiritimatiellia bacterium]